MDDWPPWWPEGCLLVLYCLLETAWALTTSLRFPAGPAHLPGVLLVVLLAAWISHRLARARLPGSWFLPLTVAVVLGARLYVVTGPRLSGLFPGAVLVLAPLVVFALRAWFRSTPADRSAWGVLVGLSLVMSTDALKVLWLQTGARRTLRPGWTLLAFLLVGAGLWLCLEGWSLGRRFLRQYAKSTLAFTALAVLMVGGYWTVRPPAPEPAASFPLDPGRIATADPSPEELPNIVLVSIDTLRWDMVPPRAAGHELPHLASLRKDSITFDHAFSETSWTLPAHVSLFTGLLPVRHGVQLPRNRIDPSLVLFPQVLRTLGYRTAAMTGGGYLSRQYGYHRGFDVYWEHGENIPLLSFRGFLPGALEAVIYLQTLIMPGPDIEWRHRFQSPVGQKNRRYFEPGLRVARQWLEGRGDRSSPFFLFLHTYEVHDADLNLDRKLERLERDHPGLARVVVHDDPLGRAPPLSDTAWRRFTEELPPGMSPARQANFRRVVERIHPEVRRTLRRFLTDLSSDERREVQLRIGEGDREALRRFQSQPLKKRKVMVRKLIRQAHDYARKRRRARKHLYGYGVESVDESLGDFLSWMKRRGLYRDSLIVFLSDHGDGFQLISEVRGHGKGRLSEVLTRVPLWIKLPGNRSAGTVVSRPVQLRHVFPMLLDELGIRLVCPDEEDILCPEHTLKQADPLPLPLREPVKTSIAYQIPSNRDRPDTDKRIKLGVRGRSYKQVHPARGDTDLYWKVFAENLRQEVILPDGIPSGRRDRLQRWMERYRKTSARAPNPFLRRQDLGRELRRDLQGLGYL